RPGGADAAGVRAGAVLAGVGPVLRVGAAGGRGLGGGAGGGAARAGGSPSVGLVGRGWDGEGAAAVIEFLGQNWTLLTGLSFLLSTLAVLVGIPSVLWTKKDTTSAVAW